MVAYRRRFARDYRSQIDVLLSLIDGRKKEAPHERGFQELILKTSSLLTLRGHVLGRIVPLEVGVMPPVVAVTSRGRAGPVDVARQTRAAQSSALDEGLQNQGVVGASELRDAVSTAIVGYRDGAIG